jgi:hypothetical protein
MKKQNQKSGGRLMLEDYLIMPVQRIPRYVLLMDQLRNATAIDHPDYSVLEGIYKQFKLVADIINKSKKIYDDENEVKKILTQIPDFPTVKLLGTSTLSLVKSGILTNISTNEHTHPKKLFLILLNKYLIVSKVTSEKKKAYNFWELMPLLNSEAFMTKSGENSCLVIKPPPNFKLHTYRLTHDNPDELLDWHKSITVTISNMVTVQDNTEELQVDVKTEVIANFMKHETQYVHNLKRLRELRSEITNHQIAEFFDFIDPIFHVHEKLREKLFDRMVDDTNNLGDIFKSLLGDLLTIYTRYCILWVEIEATFLVTKENSDLTDCVREFESGYGNTIEHFLEKIAQHLPEMYTVTAELMKHTNKETSPQEYSTLKEVSEQLQNFTDKILVLRSLNKDNQGHQQRLVRADTISARSTAQPKRALIPRFSLRW